MSFENAKENLQEFGKELNLTNLEFDENNTCILGIDDQFSMHLTYEPNSDRLYLYSPILDGLPKDDAMKLKLYEILLVGSMLGGQMAGGGVGVAVEEELILMHCTIDMAYAIPSALRAFAPLYVETVEKWRKVAEEIMQGREPSVDMTPGIPMDKNAPAGAAGKVPTPAPKKGNDAAGGGGYIKI